MTTLVIIVIILFIILVILLVHDLYINGWFKPIIKISYNHRLITLRYRYFDYSTKLIPKDATSKTLRQLKAKVLKEGLEELEEYKEFKRNLKQ